MSEPDRVDRTVRLAEWEIPDDVWSQLLPLAAAGTGELG
jgi:D-threo-aldose 1-dehydrogenase